MKADLFFDHPLKPYLFVSFSQLLQDLRIFGNHVVVGISAVGEQAICTVLNVSPVTETASAVGTQAVEGAIAEKAVKILRISALMTGKVFTGCV